MNIAFIPIDNRPVCYTLPKQISEVDKDINLLIPNREYLGSLVKNADVEKIFEWLENLGEIDSIVMCLDTIAYGGLIPSRRSTDTFEDIKNRIYRLKEILSKKKAKIYAFSSIMRISNNNVNEEEKEYWNKWGKKIFNYSFSMHKFGMICKNEVPDYILEDYLNTRKRNFDINKIYLEWGDFFETLVFSKDDCAEYGFNVQEAKELEKLGGFVKTGADEIPLTLLARAIKGNVKIAPIFLAPDYKNNISNYEDVSIEKSVLGQLNLAGCEVVDEKDADILLYINNFEEKQGEIVMKQSTNPFNDDWNSPEHKYMVADVRFANGADNAFVKRFFDKGINFGKFYGYSAWNTSANSLGSLICGAKVKFLAEQNNSYSDEAFKTLEVVRFLDDWAYQANVRQELNSIDETLIKDKMKEYEKKVFEIVGEEYNLKYKFPWHRLFEVEVCI